MRQVGCYEIVGELGRGGMAVVHLGRDPDGRLVALKELAGFHSSDEAAAQRFLREALVGSRLSHPNIVAVFQRLEEGGVPFIVMEWVDGGNLRPLVGELSVAQLGTVMDGLLAALAHAGRAGIVHRDLKPENVMLTREGVVKVADFGIAKARSVVDGLDGRLTRTGTAVGTPGYMAPEQAMGQDVTPATDLYSAGCIAFEALTGRIPFAGQAPMVMLMSHANSDVPDLRTIDPLIAEPVAEWVARMTARDPDDRFRDGEEAWTALEAALEQAIGSDWRAQAAIEPTPPEVAPPSDTTPGPMPTGGTSAFATYSAPIELYEQLAAERGEQAPAMPAAPALAATATPHPDRLTRDELEEAVRHTTPPPSPVVAPETAAEPIAAPSRSGRRVYVAGGAVVVVAAVVGGTVLTGGHKALATNGAPLSAAGVSVHTPSGWKQRSVGPIAGFKVVSAAAPNGGPADGLIALLAPQPPSAGLLPRALAVALTHPGRSVSTGSAGHAIEFTAGGSDVVVFPLANGGTLAMVCRGSVARSDCQAVAKTATGKLAGGASGDDAQSLRGALALQSAAIARAGRSVLGAHDAGSQAAAAAAIAQALGSQQLAVRAAGVSPAAQAAAASLSQAIGRLAGAWNAFGRAVQAGGGAGVGSAVNAARAELRAIAGDLDALGIPLGSSLAFGPSAPAPAKAPAGSGSGSSSGISGSGSSSGNSGSGGGSSSSGSGGGGSSSKPSGSSGSPAPSQSQSSGGSSGSSNSGSSSSGSGSSGSGSGSGSGGGSGSGSGGGSGGGSGSGSGHHHRRLIIGGP